MGPVYSYFHLQRCSPTRLCTVHTNIQTWLNAFNAPTQTHAYMHTYIHICIVMGVFFLKKIVGRKSGLDLCYVINFMFGSALLFYQCFAYPAIAKVRCYSAADHNFNKLSYSSTRFACTFKQSVY